MRQRLKPGHFDDAQLDVARTTRASAVPKAVRSVHAKAKDAGMMADERAGSTLSPSMAC